MTTANTHPLFRRLGLITPLTACLLYGAWLAVGVGSPPATATAPLQAQTVPAEDPDEYGTAPAPESEADPDPDAPGVPLLERPPHAGYAASEWRVSSADRSAIALAFTVDLLPTQANLIVTDEAGDEVPAAAPTTDGRTVAQRFADPLDDGRYAVRWQVIAADGHPMSARVDLRYVPGVSAPEITYPAVDSSVLDRASLGNAHSEGDPSHSASSAAGAGTRSLFSLRTALFGAVGAAVGLAALVSARRRNTNRGSV